jgi:hypothetical protein
MHKHNMNCANTFVRVTPLVRGTPPLQACVIARLLSAVEPFSWRLLLGTLRGHLQGAGEMWYNADACRLHGKYPTRWGGADPNGCIYCTPNCCGYFNLHHDT